MFSEIEKEYRKGLQHKRFARFYWPRAIFIVVLAALIYYLLWCDYRLVYVAIVGLLLLLVLWFFIRELHNANKNIVAVHKSRGLMAKLRTYSQADSKMRVENLVTDLAKHGIKTRDDLEVAINYYQSRLPGITKPNFLEWFLTTVITLASIILVTYNDEAGSINLHAFETALVVAGFFLTPFVIAKIISTIISVNHNKLETVLVEDLAYIFVHYNLYQNVLEKSND